MKTRASSKAVETVASLQTDNNQEKEKKKKTKLVQPEKVSTKPNEKSIVLKEKAETKSLETMKNVTNFVMAKFSQIFSKVEECESDSEIYDGESCRLKVSEKDFEVGGVLSEGSFSFVLKVYKDGRAYAAKCYRHPGDTQDSVVFQREMRNLAELSHPNICKMFGWYETTSRLYILFELAIISIEEVLTIQKVFSEGKTGNYVYQVVDALEYAHRKGVTHRDLKPGNILLFDETTVKISDFISSSSQFKRKMTTQVEPNQYSAPEMLLGKGYDSSVDVWSLGCTIYKCLTGVTPFEDEDNVKMFERIKKGKYLKPDKISKDARQIIGSMITVKSEKRLTPLEIMQHNWTQRQRERIAFVATRRGILTANRTGVPRNQFLSN